MIKRILVENRLFIVLWILWIFINIFITIKSSISGKHHEIFYPFQNTVQECVSRPHREMLRCINCDAVSCFDKELTIYDVYDSTELILYGIFLPFFILFLILLYKYLGKLKN